MWERLVGLGILCAFGRTWSVGLLFIFLLKDGGAFLLLLPAQRVYKGGICSSFVSVKTASGKMARRSAGFRVARLLALLSVVTMTSAAQGILVPGIPDSVTLENTSLYNLWTHALRNQKDDKGQPLVSDGPGPKTILNPDSIQLINLVPMGAAHPLYSNEYVDLRTEFLRDYMLSAAVSPDNAEMLQPEGLSVSNLNGKQLTFKKDAQDKITVNGLGVNDVQTLSDGIVTYTLNGFLFDHRSRVDEAFHHLQSTQPRSGPFGRPLAPPPP